MNLFKSIFSGVILMTVADLSHAYVGPGAGLSAIGSVLAFIGAIFLLIVGFLWYPIKRLIKRKPPAGPEDRPDTSSKDNISP